MAERKRKASAAPGQAYGYLVQVVRVLWHLLRATPGDVVAFETLGDVAIESGGFTLSEEDKSGLKHNPIADSSAAWWKTFANWADARRNGTLPSGCKYVLYVAQPYDGRIVQKLNSCSSISDALNIAQKLREDFVASELSGPEDSKGQILRAQKRRLFSHSDEAIAAIIVDFSLEKGISSPIKEVHMEVARSVSDDHIAEVTENLLGWVNRQVMKQIEETLPVRIPYDGFRKQRLSITRRLDKSSETLPECDIEPTDEQVAEELISRTYVRQLKLLEMGDDDLTMHISDYLRASATRTDWSEEGHIDAKGFEKFEKELVERWKLKKMHFDVAYRSKPATERGIELFFTCISEPARLQAVEVPLYFLRGSYHAIADVPHIGWHPDWKNLILRSEEGAAVGGGANASR